MTGTTRHRILFYILSIIVPLLLGLYLYLTLRADTYISLCFSKVISLPDFPYGAFPGWAVDFFRNFASDILWAYSLGFAVMLTLGYSRKRILFALFLCFGFEVIIEVLQKAGMFHGTFDYLDILFEAISTFLAIFFIYKYEEAQHEKSSKSA